MTTELLIPPWVRISGGRFSFLSNTAAFPSTFTGAIRTVDRLGDRIAVAFNSQYASHEETLPTRARLSALRARLRGQSSRVWFTESGYTLRGSFPTGELLTNPYFDGTTGWSTSSANIVLSSSDRVLRSKRASVSGDETIRATVATTVNGAVYLARVFALAGRGPMDFRIRLGTTAGGSELSASSGDITTAGMSTLVGTATGTSTHLSIVDGVSGGRAIAGYMDFPYISLSRVALIAGASQTGPSYNIDALPTSTSALAKIDDWVQIGNQIVKVVQPLDSDSSGAGVLHLSYPLRAAPADNAPVIFHQPFGRFVATENEGGYDFEPGISTNHDWSLVEDLSA